MSESSSLLSSNSGSIETIKFHGDDLLVALDDNRKPHIILRPAFEAIGLTAHKQIERLRRQPWATTGTTPVTGIRAGEKYTTHMITADVRTFLMALATVPVERCAEHVRPKLIDYQREVADVIDAHFTGSRHHHTEPNTVTWEELCALVSQRYGLVFEVPDLRRALRDGGVLKQNGAPRKNFRAWFWFTGSAWNIHPHVLPQLVRRVVDTRKALGDVQAQLMELALDAEIDRDATASHEGA